MPFLLVLVLLSFQAAQKAPAAPMVFRQTLAGGITMTARPAKAGWFAWNKDVSIQIESSVRAGRPSKLAEVKNTEGDCMARIERLDAASIVIARKSVDYGLPMESIKVFFNDGSGGPRQVQFPSGAVIH